MKKSELVEMIRKEYKSYLVEGRKPKAIKEADEAADTIEKVYVEYDSAKKERILHIPESMTGEALKTWLGKNKEALNKKYPKAKK